MSSIANYKAPAQIHDHSQINQGGDYLASAVALKEQITMKNYKCVFIARINNILLYDSKSNYLTALDFSMATLYDFSILEKK